MSHRFICPGCGEAEELTGAPSPDGIRITCGRCNISWLRDAAPEMCATCGGSELESRPRALTQYSRGTQLSIVGFSEVLLCRVCDEEMLERSKAGRAVPRNYRPAALDPEAAAERAAGSPGDDDRLITP